MRFFLLCFLSALALPTAFAAVPDEGDFLSLTGPWANPPPLESALADDTDCRARIEKVVCYVGGSMGWDRPCLPESKRYVAAFERLHDRMPEMLQRMFCSLQKLYVEKDLTSTAYALRGRPVIGIRASLLDEKLSLTQWSTWKEQLNFGGRLDSYETKDDLPAFLGESAPGDDDMLYSIIAHEFGHLFDFENNLNALRGNHLKAGSYGALSWETLSKPRPENEFPTRRKLCFYHCSSTLPASAASEVYADLYGKTNFLNSYTARNPYEDFADTFSFTILFKEAATTYKLDTRQGAVYDLREVLASPRLAEKVKFIEQFIEDENKRYP